MDAKELKVGNMVQRENFGAWDNGFHDIICTPNDIMACSIAPNKFKIVKLTKEILIKGGFDYRFGKTHTIYLKVASSVGKSFIIEGLGDLFYCMGFELKTAHQLQNIYSALTCEELQFNDE